MPRQPVNPYVAGLPLYGERGFFGRHDTLYWVMRELRNPSNRVLVLFGQRRIGKTTLLMQIRRTLPSDAFFPVYCDLQYQATRPLGHLLADLADAISERLGISPPAPEQFDNQGRFFQRNFLPQLYHLLGESRRPVFLFDEFDVLDQIDEERLSEEAAAKTLFQFLHRLMIEDRRVAFVFAVGRRAEDLSLDFALTFKASLVQEVWVLDPESARALIHQAKENGTLDFTEEAVGRILTVTNRHPYLTQLLCQRVWERAYAINPTEPPSIDSEEIEAAIDDALEAGTQVLSWLWNGLSPAEKIYSAALAEIADEGNSFTEDQVNKVLAEHARRLRRREVELAPGDLVKRRVLEEIGEREYRFSVELFRRWVHDNKPLRNVKNEVDRVEPFAERLFRLGLDLFNQRNWTDALDFFQRALASNPAHFRARLHLGETLLELGHADEAVIQLKEAYKLDRQEARLSLVRALVVQAEGLREAGDEDGALEACQQALQISPSEHAAQAIRAAIFTQQGDAALKCSELESALAAYRKAENTGKIAQVRKLIEQREQSFSLGKDLLRSASWESAAQCFRDVLRVDPRHFHAQLNLGKALLELGQVDAAVIELEQAYEMNAGEARSSLVQALLTLGRRKREEGKEEDELEAYIRALEISPGNPTVQGYLNTLWARQTARERTRDNEEKAQKIQPGVAPGRLATRKATIGARPRRERKASTSTRVRAAIAHPHLLDWVFVLLGFLIAAGIWHWWFWPTLSSWSGDNMIQFWETATSSRQYQLEHPGDVNSLGYSADGTFLASGSSDNKVRLWRIGDGTLLHRLEGHTGDVTSIALSPNGTLLASSSTDHTVRLWKTDGGTLLHTLEGHEDSVLGVAFAPDGATIASSSRDGTVRLWRAEDGKHLRTLGNSAVSATSVAFSPDGEILAAGMGDGTAVLWLVENWTSLRPLHGHTGSVTSIAFSPDGTLLATGGGDTRIQLWLLSHSRVGWLQPDDITPFRTLQGHTGWVLSVAFSPDGVLLASGAMDGEVIIWQSAGGPALYTLKVTGTPVNAVNSVIFSPDGTILATGS